ncbi:MAG: hypothetical protein L0Y70_06185 [Gemmataceae bacterium]|nr:hypothetical protein [Gemmataceae bacterium]
MGILASGKNRPVKTRRENPSPTRERGTLNTNPTRERGTLNTNPTRERESVNKSGSVWIALLVGGALLLVGGTTAALLLGQQDSTPPADPPNLAILDASSLDNLQKKIEASPLEAVPALGKQPALSPANQFAKNKPPPLLLIDVPPPKFVAPGLSQERVNEAIAKGVKYLVSTQLENGGWGGGGHDVGYAALPGLTLLESGVSAQDPAVQRAAAFVRDRIPTLNKTYELSLSILFLDRLGEANDKKLIETMALRLIAGQNSAGGWTYQVPLLQPRDADQLLAFLHKNRVPFQDPLNKGKGADLKDPLRAKNSNLQDPLDKGKRESLSDPARKSGSVELPAPLGGANKEASSKAKEPPKAADKQANLRPDFLPPNLQNLPAKGKGKAPAAASLSSMIDDNSNSQFALLGLWAARRHDAPTEKTLQLAYQRYFSTQHADGGWGYRLNMPTRDTMTCVGLLGLAMGHGANAQAMKLAAPKLPAKNQKKKVQAAPAQNQDQAITRGLQALGKHIGQPFPLTPDPSPLKGRGENRPPMENLYLLWSVERVAMLYDLKTIGGKDWYGWGATILIPNQNPGGSWHSGRFHGSTPPIDTSFALLFLKRSNLVQDLTQELQLLMAITDPASSKK